MNAKSFLLLLSAILLFSCCKRKTIPHNADYSEVDTISYDYTKSKNIISRDSIFGEISFICLETTDNNLIGMVDQVLFGDSTIIVVDRMIANGIFLFDYNGKYVGRMSRMGNGHNEYRRLSYVSKRPDNKYAVFDEISGVIMVFDERGRYIEKKRSDLYASAMEYISQDLMAFDIFARYPHNYKPFYGASYVIKGSDMKIEYTFGLPELDSHFNYSRYYNLYSYGRKVYCNVNFDDYIYELNESCVKAKYFISFGPENVSRHSFRTQEEYYALKDQYPYFEGEFVELADYTYVMFRGENGRELLYKHSSKDT